jgi:hypothetical protein
MQSFHIRFLLSSVKRRRIQYLRSKLVMTLERLDWRRPPMNIPLFRGLIYRREGG